MTPTFSIAGGGVCRLLALAAVLKKVLELKPRPATPSFPARTPSPKKLHRPEARNADVSPRKPPRLAGALLLAAPVITACKGLRAVSLPLLFLKLGAYPSRTCFAWLGTPSLLTTKSM